MTGIPKAEFHDKRIDMAFWYPKLEQLDVPTPTSYKIELDRDVDGPPEYDTNDALVRVRDLGGEAFARSGYKSAQIDLRHGSHIRSADADEVDTTLRELVSQHAMMQMPLGKHLWLREWLDLNFCSYARENLVPEVRAFIRDGEVVCHHPRLEGFGDHESHRETATEYIDYGWGNEVADYAQTVADAFEGCWSVDFVLDRSGDWYCTDMALDALYDLSERGKDGWSNISEHPGDCEHDWERHV